MRRSVLLAVWRRAMTWARKCWALGLGALLLVAVLGVLLFGALPPDQGRVLLQYIAAPLASMLATVAGLQAYRGPPPPPVPAVVPSRRRTVARKSRTRRE